MYQQLWGDFDSTQCLQASSELDAEVKKLSSERQRLAGEVQMKREMEQQYAKRCTLQVRLSPCGDIGAQTQVPQHFLCMTHLLAMV